MSWKYKIKSWKYLAKNFAKNVHPGSLNAEPSVKVAEVVEELLEILSVVYLPDYLLYHAQNVHPVPVNASRKSFNPQLRLVLQQKGIIQAL